MKLIMLSLAIGLAVGWSGPAWSDETAPDDAAIRKTVASYVAAFNKGDAKTLAEHWSPEAVYTNRFTGESAVGRAAITQQFTALFKAKKELKLDVQVESIQLLSPNAAVEHGTATLVAAKGEPEEFPYTAIYVKRDGHWLLDRVTDGTDDEPPTPAQQLKTLEWMVGKWVDEDEHARVETECHWAKNRNFLIRSFSIFVEDRIDMSGMQVIGWDAAEKRIRSWTFDSDGGFGEGIWTKKGNQWFIQNKGVLADGRRATGVNVIKPIDDDTFTWQTVERTVAGELLPNVEAVRIVRSP